MNNSTKIQKIVQNIFKLWSYVDDRPYSPAHENFHVFKHISTGAVHRIDNLRPDEERLVIDAKTGACHLRSWLTDDHHGGSYGEEERLLAPGEALVELQALERRLLITAQSKAYNKAIQNRGGNGLDALLENSEDGWLFEER